MSNLKSAIEQIRDRIDINDIVGRRIKLDRNNKALCPFHEEKVPSFFVDPAKQRFRCYGCGAHGDVFEFLQLYENKTFWEVLSELARETGVTLPHNPHDREKIEKERTIEDILTETARFYHTSLTEEVRNYLTSRDITEETISRFQIGYANGGLRQHLAGKKFPIELCIEAGVLKKNDKGEIRDFFYNRIIFPNPRRGRVVHMSGRSLNGNEPRYLHLPVEIRHLYNEDVLLMGKEVYITEGIPDCLSAIQLGYPAVAILGARSFKKEHAERFFRCERVYVCLDPDKAGQEGSREISRLMGDKARIISLPPDSGDLNEYLASHSKDDFDALVKSAQDAVRYELSLIPEDIDKIELPKLLEPILKSIAGFNHAGAEAYLDVIKIRFGLLGRDVNAYRKVVNGYRKEQNKKPDNAPGKEQDALPFLEVTPCPEPVDPAQLLTDISDTVRRFVVCDQEIADAVALWTAMTWFIDVIRVAPLAVITAPEMRCGKSILLSLMGHLSARPIMASNISPAALYRSIELWYPTLLVDEADSFLKDNEELRGILNSGHTRDTAYVIRTVGDEYVPTRFSTWGAKAIAGIGSLAGTLMDRAIVLGLRRKLPNEKVDRLNRVEPELFNILQAKLARFAEDRKEQVEKARSLLPDQLNDRAQDNWEPLLAIAMTAGDEWLKTAMASALRLSGDSDSAQQSMGTELLADIRKAFGDEKTAISCKDLIEILCADDERPWATYNKGKPIQARGVANILRRYGIRSNAIRNGGDVSKSYKLKQFNDVFSRYLPSTEVKNENQSAKNIISATSPISKVTGLQLAPTNDLQHFLLSYKDEMLLKENQRKPLINANCNPVTLEKPPAGEKNKNTNEKDANGLRHIEF